MTKPNPDLLYDVVCPACFRYLGRVYAHHADHLAEVHIAHCPATDEEREQAIADVDFARVTGDTTILEQRRLSAS